jgi:hypothetical protein
MIVRWNGVLTCCSLGIFFIGRENGHGMNGVEWHPKHEPLPRRQMVAVLGNLPRHKQFYDLMKKRFKIVAQSPVSMRNHERLFTVLYENK